MTRNICCVLVVILAVVILSMGGCGGGSKEPGRYYADELDFSIKFPEGWEIQVENYGYTVSAYSPLDSDDDMLYETISVSVENLMVSVDLDEYFDAVNRTSQSQLAYFELESAETVTIGDIRAKRAVFSYVNQGETVRSVGYCIVKGRRAYLITCISDDYSYDNYAQEFASAAESFRAM
ncbi:MAG: hypothetical protein JSV52_13755 [Candidatus Zixiibacteriota bacterium]|nr:MAG: hypothetical protein JSV52_13755 [candidate division Zixibacteria bacterium]